VNKGHSFPLFQLQKKPITSSEDISESSRNAITCTETLKTMGTSIPQVRLVNVKDENIICFSCIESNAIQIPPCVLCGDALTNERSIKTYNDPLSLGSETS
jgi:hypothetical protein